MKCYTFITKNKILCVSVHVFQPTFSPIHKAVKDNKPVPGPEVIVLERRKQYLVLR